MQLSNSPDKVVLPFAAAGVKNTIPVDSQIGITPGAASLETGFPPLTFTPITAGGVPPSGADFNGILNELSAVIRWANAGGGYPYDSTFANDVNVGGYPKSARVARSDGLGYWFNTVDNNVTDPEGAGAVAAGWVPDYTTGASAITMTSSNVTLTALEYGKPIIVITGLLTTNLNLVFPAIYGQWVVINNTTGAYTITAKTASGTGVVIDDVQPLIGDGTNITSPTKPVANIPFAVAGGTGDVITATFTPAFTSLSDATGILVEMSAANTVVAPTINIDGLGAISIVKYTNTALLAGDIPGANFYAFLSYDASLNKFVLNNPSPKPAITGNFPQGYIYGCILSNNVSDPTNDIDISTGTLKDSANTLHMVVASAIGKRIDAAWTQGGTPGTTVGGFPTGIALTNNTWYRMFIIGKADGTVDAGFDTSSTATNLLTDAVGFTYYQQVGWVRRGVGANLLFFQNGDDFTWDVPSVDVNAASGSAAGVDVTLLCPPGTLARFQSGVYSGSALQYIIFTETRQTNTAPGAAQYDMVAHENDYAQASEFVRRLDSSSQLRERSTGVSTGYSIFTKGWSGRY